MADFLETVKSEWQTIKYAPWSFGTVTIVIFGVVWFIFTQMNSATISAKDATIETLKSQADTLKTENNSYKNKLNGASPEEAKAKISELEARLSRIEPRRLNVDDYKIILEALKKTGKTENYIMLESDLSCSDCGQLAADFQALFNEAGWKIERAGVMGPSAASSTGIAILTPNLATPLPEAKAIDHGLEEAKISRELKIGGDKFGPRYENLPQVTTILLTQRSSF